MLHLSFFQIFAPTLFEEHWSCYVLQPKDKTLYVLDSMRDTLSTSKKNLDDATVVLIISFFLGKNLNYYFCKIVIPNYSSGPTYQRFFNLKKRRFEELLVLMNPGSTKENVSITLVYADVPRQKNM